MRSDASAAEIRAAYLARARLHHPDVATGDQRATSASMAELNRAYQVLRTPASRAQYDRQLHEPPPHMRPTGSAAGGSHHGDIDSDDMFDDESFRSGSRGVGKVLSPSGPARMPWRFMAVAAVVGSVVILASSALDESPQNEPPDGILRVGSCVQVEPNNDVREIACGPEAELVVRLVIPTDATCPPAYLPYRDRLGLGTACVEPIDHGEA